MKTLADLAASVAKGTGTRLVTVNKSLMKASIANKRRPGYIQIALSDGDV